MATHSNILAWEIPRTEEPGGLQSTGPKELDTNEQLTVSLSPWLVEVKKYSSSIRTEDQLKHFFLDTTV